MPEYSIQNTLRVAKRFQNTKRTYLLVNPLQAKHIPVPPRESLQMMETLGSQLAREFPGTRLAIGFAETATAIGAAVASQLGDGCIYLHTTREAEPDVKDWVLFSEEHSHVVEQKLCADQLPQWLEGTESVIFVDDEITTGKTLLNMIRQLRERYPSLGNKRLVAASLLNRLSPEDQRRLSEAGVECRWLVKLPEMDPAGAVAGLAVEEAPEVNAEPVEFSHRVLACGPLPNPRRGVLIRDYQKACGQLARPFGEVVRSELEPGSRVVTLGTEECMYPVLVLGERLEQMGFSTTCHATTRSPIGICTEPGYPIVSGGKLKSFYEDGRSTYIYNLSKCDALVVVSDAASPGLDGLRDLLAAWKPYGCRRLFLIQGGQNVWYV